MSAMTNHEDPATAAFMDAGRQALVAAAGALAAGVASLTFVALVGAAVTMARLRGAGLPTEVGVSVQPRSVLLAVGGETLAPAIAFALAAIFIVHFIPHTTRWLPIGRPAQVGSDRHFRWRDVRRLRWRDVRRLRWRDVRHRLRRHLLAFAIAAFGWLYYWGWSAGALHFPLQTAISVVMLVFAGVIGYVSERLAARAVEARDVRHSRADKRPIEEIPKPEDRRLARVEVTYLAGIAAVVLLFATISAVIASVADPKVRPAAVVFVDSRVPLCGVFVAQNADHVYIGEAVENHHIPHIGVHSQGRIIDLQRNSVRGLIIGSSQSLSSARRRAATVVKELMTLNGIATRGARLEDC